MYQWIEIKINFCMAFAGGNENLIFKQVSLLDYIYYKNNFSRSKLYWSYTEYLIKKVIFYLLPISDSHCLALAVLKQQKIIQNLGIM